MSMRIEPIPEAIAGEQASAVFELANATYGWLPNTIRVMTGSRPAADPLYNLLARAAGRMLAEPMPAHAEHAMSVGPAAMTGGAAARVSV
jgi:hypothetical protein